VRVRYGIRFFCIKSYIYAKTALSQQNRCFYLFNFFQNKFELSKGIKHKIIVIAITLKYHIYNKNKITTIELNAIQYFYINCYNCKVRVKTINNYLLSIIANVALFTYPMIDKLLEDHNSICCTALSLIITNCGQTFIPWLSTVWLHTF
jgi:hypothetical protein